MAKVTAAVDAARLRYQTERGCADATELEDEFDGFPSPAADGEDDGKPRLGRGMRNRSKPDRLIGAVLGKKHRDACPRSVLYRRRAASTAAVTLAMFSSDHPSFLIS